MKKHLAFLVAVTLSVGFTRLHAEPAPNDGSVLEQKAADLVGDEIVDDKDLANSRGGFVWSGVDVSLGAEMRTYVNGTLVLQTNVSWNAQSAQQTQFVSGTLTPVDVAELQSGVVTGAGISVRVGNASVFMANEGQTLIAQNSDNTLQNVLINRASNVNIKQQIDATVDLQNFAQFQNSVLGQRIGSGLADMVTNAALTGSR